MTAALPPPELDRRRVAAARLWAANRFPYLAAAVFASPVVATEGLGGVSADSSWRLYVDPAVVAAWPVEQLGSVMVHLVGHLLRDHAERAQEAGVAEGEEGRWVDAADAEINDDLDELHFPGPPVLPRDLGCQPGGLAEHYYAHGHEREGERWGCGSSAHGRQRDHELAPTDAPGPAEGQGQHGDDDDGDGEGDGERPAEGLGAESRRLLRRQVANEVLAHAQAAGDAPAGLRRWAERQVQGRVDWRRALAAELRRGLHEVAGRVDYSYRRPSRRAAAWPDVVLPSLRRPLPEVAVVCDTSASMDGARLGRALAEVDGLLRAAGVGPGGLRVLACDTAVHTARRVTSARDVELLGGGGTDMGAAIAAAVELRPRPGVVVVLTDGETPWPAGPPRGVSVVVGLLDRRGGHAPSWARAVRIDDESA